jgi:hypothetical protein
MQQSRILVSSRYTREYVGMPRGLAQNGEMPANAAAKGSALPRRPSNDTRYLGAGQCRFGDDAQPNGVSLLTWYAARLLVVWVNHALAA